ncbi:MAG TPA: nucleotide sugar dehydrogenase [Actinomycetota bacterium]|jgi:nucleotide sugar dehydrogenase|nr:nucleotide sugar dehydrogenase [Actinomycetota bacterium]
MTRSAPAWFAAARERISRGEAPVCVLGCGYVGLTLALECARAGSAVTGIETDEVRAKDLRAGANPVPDVLIPDGELAQLRDGGRLTFMTALDAPADVYVICVNTPLRDGSPDLRFVESAGESVARVLTEGAVVVLESTTYPGTTEELLRPILEEGTGLVAGRDFALAHSPERIDPGNRDWTMRNTPKVVGGLTPESTELVSAFYSRVCDNVVGVTSPRAAEITKLFENTYREVNIALANEMAITCHDFDIDPWEVLRAAATKPFGFTPFRPGPGVGGHCIPVDPQYLAWRVRGKVGRQFRLLETASDINQRMPSYVVQRAAEILNHEGKALRGANILLLGVSYKGGSGDVRESPALRVADRLVASGASVSFHDPHVPTASINGVVYDSQALDDAVLAGSDVVIVLTDHPDVDYARVLDRAPCVYDTRGVMERFDGSAPNLHRF